MIGDALPKPLGFSALPPEWTLLMLAAAGEGAIMAGPVGATPPLFGGDEWTWLLPFGQ